MASLRKVELEDDILITLKLSKKEYEIINPEVKEFIVLPSDDFERILVTGRLGHGNRIMIPGKFLKANNIKALKKKVNSRIVNTGERKFLIIELEDNVKGIPVFGDDEFEN